MPLEIIHNDITLMKCDAIVNAANKELLPGGGVCGAIFNRAGYELLNEACQKQAPITTGEAIMTPAFQLSAQYIIHAAGPIYQDGKHQEKQLLKNAYQNSLQLAIDHQLESIAFPLISSGIYGYPKKEALEVAVDTIKSFLSKHDLTVYLVVFDKTAVQISQQLYHDVQHYIDTYFIDDRRQRVLAQAMPERANVPEKKKRTLRKVFSLDELLHQKKETFSDMLLRLIDEKGYSDVQTYKKANIDRKLFSKIRSHKDYQPKKKTVLAFAIALELNLDQTNDLLNKAGYSLSNSQKADIIVQYFIENKIYDIYKINETLFCFDQKTL